MCMCMCVCVCVCMCMHLLKEPRGICMVRRCGMGGESHRRNCIVGQCSLVDLAYWQRGEKAVLHLCMNVSMSVSTGMCTRVSTSGRQHVHAHVHVTCEMCMCMSGTSKRSFEHSLAVSVGQSASKRAAPSVP